MALPTTGQISISDICVELGLAPTTNISLNDSRFRKLAKKETDGSTISMSDFHGKSNFEYSIYTGSWASSKSSNWQQDNPTTYSRYLRVVVTTENSGIQLKEAFAYDQNGAVIAHFPMTTTPTASPYQNYFAHARVGGITPYSGSGGGQPTYSTVGTNAPYEAGILLLIRQVFTNITLHRIEVVDVNGNVYDLVNHRNIVVPSANTATPKAPWPNNWTGTLLQ